MGLTHGATEVSAALPESESRYQQWLETFSPMDWARVEGMRRSGLWAPKFYDPATVAPSEIEAFEQELESSLVQLGNLLEDKDGKLARMKEQYEVQLRNLSAVLDRIQAKGLRVRRGEESLDQADAAELREIQTIASASDREAKLEERYERLLRQGKIKERMGDIGRAELTFVNDHVLPVVNFDTIPTESPDLIDQRAYVLVPKDYVWNSFHALQFKHRKFLKGGSNRTDGQKGRDITFLVLDSSDTSTQKFDASQVVEISEANRPDNLREKAVTYAMNIPGKVVMGDVISSAAIWAPFQALVTAHGDLWTYINFPERFKGDFDPSSIQMFAPAIFTGTYCFVLTLLKSWQRNWENLSEKTRFIKNLSVGIVFFVFYSAIRGANFSWKEILLAGATSIALSSIVKMFLTLKTVVQTQQRTLNGRQIIRFPFLGEVIFNANNWDNDRRYNITNFPGKIANQAHIEIKVGAVTIPAGLIVNCIISSILVWRQYKALEKQGDAEAISLYRYHLQSPLRLARSLVQWTGSALARAGGLCRKLFR